MFVTDRAGDLLDPQVAALEEVGSSSQLLFDDKLAKTKTRLPLEHMLKMRLAQIEFTRETMNATGSSGFDGLEDLADAFSLQLIRR